MLEAELRLCQSDIRDLSSDRAALVAKLNQPAADPVAMRFKGANWAGFQADGCPHHLRWWTSDEHIARLAQSEGVDLALSKLGVRLELVAESITRALALKRGKRDSKESITRRSRHLSLIHI